MSADPVTIAEIVGQLTAEADRIKEMQKVLVDAGGLKAPDAGMMRRALVFDAAADMLFRIEPVQAEVKAMLKKRGLGATGRLSPVEVQAERETDAEAAV
jgi:hypothetical protein